MSSNDFPIISGDILDSFTRLKQPEFQRICQISGQFLTEMIEEGIIEPEIQSERESENYLFNGIHIRQARRANRLSCDLGINPPGIALVLELLDKIERLEKDK
ncbi:MAG: chaperone modulator CbpM [Kangiellaceae bacterium]|nr:chaperone modulator CbpM [Kangiellaceae bacterium]